MTLNPINIQSVIQETEALVEQDQSLAPAIKTAIRLLITIILLLSRKFKLDSHNSSMPPSADGNREKGSKKNKSDKKPGGQKGHQGYRIEKISNPDRIEFIAVDRRKLPKGIYREVGFKSRQVIDIELHRVVTEYRAQILEDSQGNRYQADFPERVKTDVQYGTGVKVHTIYMSQFQLLPYERIQDQLSDQVGVCLSTGTLVQFNREAYQLLEQFEIWVKKQLALSNLLHVDETGININKKRYWLHNASNSTLTYFYPHPKRGSEAMDEIGILPLFQGIACHDHWKPYFKYSCEHALCNAHHLRELTYLEEIDHQNWAKEMRLLLLTIKKSVDLAGGSLSPPEVNAFKEQYRKILNQAEQTECPPPQKIEKKRGRIKKTKARNLLERLRDFEKEILRFMEDPLTPFTNNQGENDLRMTKVQQKISGCFRSLEGAYMFCRIRSYLSTCRKNQISATDALHLLFQGKMPDFVLDL